MAQSSGELIALIVFFTSLGIVAVGLRLYARHTKGLRPAIDDYFAVAAAVCGRQTFIEWKSSQLTRFEKIINTGGVSVPIILRNGEILPSWVSD